MKLLLFFCLFIAAASARRTFRGDQVFRVSVNEDQFHELEKLTDVYELDFWSRSRSSPDIRVPAKHLLAFKLALKRIGVNYSIYIDDVQALIDTERSSHPVARNLATFDYEVYHTLEEIEQWIDDIVGAYPILAKKNLVGTSYEGRTFNALSISSGAGNPQFVINCGIHAREWITPATCMFSAKYLLEGYGSDSTITKLVNNVDFVFIPVSNPDGYAYTWTNDRMWRKTRTKRGGFCVGVDPNRNWDSNHCGQGSSTSPCSDTYCGPTPHSEPCVVALKEFVEGLPNVKMFIDVHSYSQMMLFPYGYTTTPAPNDNILQGIADDSVAAIRSTHGKFYEAGSISTVIYVASGGTIDYFYDGAGIKCAFAPELRDTGRYGFLLPENQIKPNAEEIFAAYKVMAQAIIDGKCN